MIGCIPRGRADDPDTYFRALVALLGAYPIDVVQAVIDPRYGLPAQCEWLPKLAEVKKALEREMAPIYRAREHEQRKAEMQKYLPPASCHGDRPTLEELRAKHGDRWGIKQDDGMHRCHKWEPPSLDEMCSTAGISRETFEALNAEAVKWLKQTTKQR